MANTASHTPLPLIIIKTSTFEIYKLPSAMRQVLQPLFSLQRKKSNNNKRVAVALLLGLNATILFVSATHATKLDTTQDNVVTLREI